VSSRGLILGIETSCDETAAAIVERGERTLSSVVASQIATHARYGGVVPELASREHLRAIVPVVRTALAEACVALDDLDAIAVTSGPGLAGALLVGITYAKALAFAQGLPLIAVNHLEGHIHAVLLNEREQKMASGAQAPEEECVGSRRSGTAKAVPFQTTSGDRAYLQSLKRVPSSPTLSPKAGEQGGATAELEHATNEPALALVVSGGHTHLYLARPADRAWRYTLVGRTVDDAAGEAYDKVAKLLGLGYPGGPWIDALAQYGNPNAVPFSFAQIRRKAHLAGKTPRTKAARTAPIAQLDPRFLFSFSGIKTAVLRYVELHDMRREAEARAARLFPRSDPHSEPGAPPSAANRAGWSAKVGDLKQSPSVGPPKSREEALGLCSQSTLDLLASFQHAVVGDLMKKTFAAAETYCVSRLLITGGVAANRELRARFTVEAASRGLSVSFPTLSLSTDNAAMIAAAAWPRFQAGEFAPGDLTADPSLALGV
jgi:N6-L-threonylcarbamoyladenine synthase